ncbi:MAG: inositol monophosphatase family protein [Candidatus Thermoplasmatota archaeon]
MNDYDFLEFARTTVESTVSSLKENIRKRLKVEYKSKFDLFTEMDKYAENEILKAIKKNFPEHDIVTEETDMERGGSDYVWYIDPISGSTNYAHGFPIYGVSLALKVGGKMKIGVIYNSIEDKVFYAERGKGAYLESEEISVSDIENIEKSIVSTTFPYNEQGRKKNLEYFNNIAPKLEGIRRTGSVSVDFSYLSLGLLDGFWAVDLEPWDTSAGWLLVEESGGKVSKLNGDDYGLEAESILLSNGKIHEDMIEVLKREDI